MKPPADSPAHASATLGILAGDPIIKARWMRGGWFDPISALWRELSTGKFQPTGELPADNRPAYNGGSVLVKGELAPGARITYPVVITWYFPNIGETNPKSCCEADKEKPQPVWHPFYSTKWKDATDVLFYVRDRYEYLKTQTLNFQKALFSSSLPISVLDAVSANLAIIKSPTVIRYENGDMWCWEGCFCDKGCCPGSCTHVLNYAQSIPHLFPSLERTLRHAELEKSMDERGHVTFRAALPGLPTSHDFHAAADGQLGGIMKLYRDWQICGDREWLKRMYPLARQSMRFCIAQWDPRHVGLTEEPHHNTYDIEFWGPDGLCSSMYLGALKAMIELAHDSDNHSDAAEFESLLQAGINNIEQRLFNGEYYQQEIMVNQLNDNSFAQKIAALQEDMSEEAVLLKTEGPKYQVGTGCLSDGVFGAWLAKACGLESPQNQDSIRSHLAAVYKHNFKSSLWSHANPQRPGYALGDESGLLLCTWPKGNKPTLPFVYSDEVWTGIEYQVASHMISLGMVEEGLAIVESVRSRYDGRTRNPWNEYECGSFYARAMASFGLLIALSGFRYSAATHSLYISPAIEQDIFTCFFSTASGWGVFTLTEQNLIVELAFGELFIENLFVTIHGQTISIHPEVHVHAGEKTTIDLHGGNS